MAVSRLRIEDSRLDFTDDSSTICSQLHQLLLPAKMFSSALWQYIGFGIIRSQVGDLISVKIHHVSVISITGDNISVVLMNRSFFQIMSILNRPHVA
ncbi:hypothetical protein AVEN_32760-1 [Araneus ventricosus]|uniref:Uncharacterized protein n=1 Tax=Araneus ventricosus TaxID=182803 RepID=A0A4Y2CVS9_ARAVE|nr:hypothetical protein AVEN_32760-1 [Araneus ventricosus]